MLRPTKDPPATEESGGAAASSGLGTEAQGRPGGGYAGVLAIPGFKRLLLSSLLGRLPLGASSLAILLLVREHTGSFATAGLTVGTFAVTGAIAAPVQGALLDRFGPKRVLIPCAALQALALVALVLVATDGGANAAIIAVAGVAGALVPPISACARVLWPRIAPTPETVETAYALDATAQEAIWTAGPLMVAVVVSFASPAAALLATVALLVIGTALFVSAPAIQAWPVQQVKRSPGGALVSRPLRWLLASAGMFGLGLGALEVGLPALSIAIHSTSMAGVLLAAWSVGSMAGGLLYGARSWSSPIERRYTLLLLAAAILILPLLVADSLGVGIAFALLAGLPGAAVLSCQYVLVGRAAPPGALAEAFTWSLASLITGVAAGSAIAGQLVDSTEPGKAFLLGAAATALAGLLAIAPGFTRSDPAG